MAGKVVYVELVAQVKRFNQGMKKAESGLARVRKAALLVSTAILAIGGLALRELSRSFDDMTEKLDTLGKTAKKTGLQVEAIQDFGFAIERSGGNANSLNKAFQTMLYATGQAKIGLKSYQDAFASINIDHKRFAKLKPEEQFLAIMDGLRNADDETRAFAAQTLLGGRVVKDWAAALRLTREEFNALIKESQAIGNVTKPITDNAEALDDLNTSLAKAKEFLKANVWNEFAKVLIPIKERAVEFWKALSDEKRMMIVKGVIAAIIGLFAVMGLALVGIVAAAGPFLVVGAKVLAFGVALGALFYNIGLGIYTVIDNIDDLGRSFQWLGDQIKEAVGGFGGKVLKFFGFDTDDISGFESTDRPGLGPASRASAPAPVSPSSVSTSSPEQNYTSNHYYQVSGMTAEQLDRRARANEDATRRGSRR